MDGRFWATFFYGMRLRREPLLGVEAPNVFHALRGRWSVFCWGKKGTKKAPYVFGCPQIEGKNLIQSSRLHPIKSISSASP